MTLKRTTKLVAVTAAMGMLLALVVIPPASAGVICGGDATTAPDGRIKFSGQPFEGAGTYPSDGVFDFLGTGDEQTFTMKWKNVDTSARTIRLRIWSVAKDPGISARYFLGPFGDVTKVLKHDGLRFKNVAPGASTGPLKLLVRYKTAGSMDTLHASVDGKYAGAAASNCDRMIAQVNPF
jgi:hypothetical protein